MDINNFKQSKWFSGVLLMVFVCALATGIVMSSDKTTTKDEIAAFYSGFMVVYITVAGILYSLTSLSPDPVMKFPEEHDDMTYNYTFLALSISAILSFTTFNYDARFVVGLVWSFIMFSTGSRRVYTFLQSADQNKWKVNNLQTVFWEWVPASVMMVTGGVGF